MENDTPNPITHQLLIHISEAAILTDPDFAITACNPAALALFLYNQQDILGQSFSFLLAASSTTNTRIPLSNTSDAEHPSTGSYAQLRELRSKEFEKRSGIKITFEPGLAHLPVNNDVATSLFRIYQEALTNIARHANAKTVFSKIRVQQEQINGSIKQPLIRLLCTI